MRTITLTAILLAFVGTELLAKAAEPQFMVGGLCPPGSSRTRPWILMEDQNGDGYYDFMTAGDCNGDVRGRPWNPSVDELPFTPMETDIYYGRLPNEVANVHPDLSFTEEPNGLYSWLIIERVSITPGGMPGFGTEVCRIGRDADGVLSTTCPPMNGDGGEDLE